MRRPLWRSEVTFRCVDGTARHRPGQTFYISASRHLLMRVRAPLLRISSPSYLGILSAVESVYNSQHALRSSHAPILVGPPARGTGRCRPRGKRGREVRLADHLR
jgi:hypothetical protein